MKNMRRSLRRFQTEVHQLRRLKKDLNQHSGNDGGIPHYIEDCPLIPYDNSFWDNLPKSWTAPTAHSEITHYRAYPKLLKCGDGYTNLQICPCLYTNWGKYRFKEQPQGKLSTRMIGHGWKDWKSLEEINSLLKFKEGVEEYYNAL